MTEPSLWPMDAMDMAPPGPLAVETANHIGELDILNTLSQEQIGELLNQHGHAFLSGIGPFLHPALNILAQVASSIWAEKNRQNSKEQNSKEQNSQEQNSKEQFTILLDLLKNNPQIIKQREVRIVEGAFNSTPAFTNTFTNTAALALVLSVTQGVNELRKIGCRLEGIQGELEKLVMAKFQGWENDGFGSGIHRFVQMEMRGYNTHRDNKHFFYLYHPGTDWYPRFEEKRHLQPLGPNFGGYSSDLEALFQMMRANRQTLSENSSDGKKAMFHLLIPAWNAMAIEQPFLIHEEILPLTIKSQTHDNENLVWLHLPEIPAQLTLEDVGRFWPDRYDDSKDVSTIFSCFCGAVACFAGIAATAAFPPLAAYEIYFASAYVASIAGGMGTGFKAMGMEMYYDMNAKTPLVLGRPLFVA